MILEENHKQKFQNKKDFKYSQKQVNYNQYSKANGMNNIKKILIKCWYKMHIQKNQNIINRLKNMKIFKS